METLLKDRSSKMRFTRNTCAFILLTGLAASALPQPVPIPDHASEQYHHVPTEVRVEEQNFVRELILAAHRYHDPLDVLSTLRTLDFTYAYNNFFQDAELDGWPELDQWPNRLERPEFVVNRQRGLEIVRDDYYHGTISLDGYVKDLEFIVSPVDLPETRMPEYHADRTIEAIESVLAQYGRLITFERQTRAANPTVLEYKGLLKYDGLTYGQCFTTLKLDLRTGGIQLYEIDIPRDPNFEPRNRDKEIGYEKAKAIGLQVLANTGLIQQGRYYSHGFFYTKRGNVEDKYSKLFKETFLVAHQPLEKHLAPKPANYYGISCSVSVIDSETELFTVYLDWELGEPYLITRGIFVLGFGSSRSATNEQAVEVLVSGIWQLSGTSSTGSIEETDLAVEDDYDASVLLQRGEDSIIFEWCNIDEILVYDGKVYRPDDALAEAIRNRPITDPPAWLVEALKDKE
jgi:hypothetical protein